MDEIRKAKRAGNVRLVRQLREATHTFVAEDEDGNEIKVEIPLTSMEEPTHPEHQE